MQPMWQCPSIVMKVHPLPHMSPAVKFDVMVYVPVHVLTPVSDALHEGTSCSPLLCSVHHDVMNVLVYLSSVPGSITS